MTIPTPISIRVAPVSDASCTVWQVTSPRTPDADERLREYVSATIAFAERHRIPLDVAVAERPHDPLVHTSMALVPLTPACLTYRDKPAR